MAIGSACKLDGQGGAVTPSTCLQHACRVHETQYLIVLDWNP